MLMKVLMTPPTRPAGDASRQATILIVEDDLPFCRAAAELLADRGFRVVGYATTARDAVVECRRLGPDAVLLDVRLPDGHGVELVSTLRAVPSPPSIVLTSSDATAVSPEQLRVSGASGFIPKSKLAHSDLHTLFNSEPLD
jgi:DNA-binding NarL/FixJ family response regulator